MVSAQPPRDNVTKRIDDYIGERVRARRLELGWTQEVLASQLNISYQQVQKYESGANRINAGRLFELAQLLETDISYFFEGADKYIEKGMLPKSKSRSTIDMMRYFSSIKDQGVQSALTSLAKELSHLDLGSPSNPS